MGISLVLLSLLLSGRRMQHVTCGNVVNGCVSTCGVARSTRSLARTHRLFPRLHRRRYFANTYFPGVVGIRGVGPVVSRLIGVEEWQRRYLAEVIDVGSKRQLEPPLLVALR